MTRAQIGVVGHRRRVAATRWVESRNCPRELPGGGWAMTAIVHQTQAVSSQGDSRRIVTNQRLPTRLITLRGADVCNRPLFGGAVFDTAAGLFAAARVVLRAAAAGFLGPAVRGCVLVA
jgi:hypothetical protein